MAKFSMLRRHFLTVCSICAVATSHAQSLPNPIRIVVGFPAGGTADAVARLYADGLRQELGVNVIVENKVGAGGQIAAESFRASAPADGSTLLLANSHMMATLPLTKRTIRYDPIKDFLPISQLATFEIGLIAGAGTKVTSLAEYVAAVRVDQRLGQYGIPAPGSSPQFIGFSIGQKEKLLLNPVPYRGGAPLVTDLIGGHIPAGIDAVGSVIEHVHAGKLRVLAVASKKRMPALPNVPTFAELGYKDLNRASWMGLFAPIGTPPAIVARVQKAVAATAIQPRLAEQLSKLAIQPASSSSVELGDIVRQELAAWAPIVKASGYEAE